MIHDLKTLPEFFEAVISGKKKFEVRRADRPFHVGDLLALNEYDSETQEYSGRSCILKIEYILDDPEYCKSGYVTISFSAMTVAPYENIRGPLDERGVVPLATRGE